MRFAIDAMGGDHAPQALLEGTLTAAAAMTADEFLLVAMPETIQAIQALPANVQTRPCGSVMGMDESVESLVQKKDSSIWIATDLVKKGEADAVISAGSTAAQMAAATLLLGRLKGVTRPAIATVLPTLSGARLLLDVGANADCTPEMLLQFAEMGAVYAEQLQGVSKPRIALLSNGTEAHKGNKLTQAAYALIKESGLHFIGNREGRDILFGDYDVIVCDGMSGNIAIKSIEGTVAALMSMIKHELTANFKSKLGAALIRDGMYRVKAALDYQEYGGAPLLGIKGVSIVCHGSSEARAITNAIRLAERCVKSEFVEKTAAAVRTVTAEG